MNVDQIVILARKHATNGAYHEDSARFCLADAVNSFNKGDLEATKRHALRSLKYSIGILHADYARASKV